ncbi:MAG TPA: hypothetical protein VGK67_21380 [Myxococcales bacterium]|jgi:hypothetical protein
MATTLYLYACVDTAPTSLPPAGIFGEPLKALPVGDLFVVGEPISDPRLLLQSKSDRMPKHAALIRALQAKMSGVMPIFYGTTIEEERVSRLDPAFLKTELARVKGTDAMRVEIWGNTKRLPKRPKANAKKPLPELPEVEWITAAVAKVAKEQPSVQHKFLEEVLAGTPTWVREELSSKSKLDAPVAVLTQNFQRGKDAEYRKLLEAAATAHEVRLDIQGPQVSYGSLFPPKAPKPAAEAPTP